MSSPTTDLASLEPLPLGNLKRIAPGLALCAAVALAALGLARFELSLFGHAWLEPLVLAYAARARWPIKPAARDLIARVREAWTPAPRSEAPATNG